MYLSRVALDPGRPGARRLLDSHQRLHAAVLSAFPDPPTGERPAQPRVLWRLDPTSDERLALYVASPDRPDFTHLADQRATRAGEHGTSKPYGPLLEQLAVGQRWAFRLTANPTRYAVTGSTTSRVACQRVDEQLAWLADQGRRHGFALVGGSRPAVRVSATRPLEFVRRQRQPPVTILAVTYDGTLAVQDPDRLREALVTGIGPAKAYGCGLLTLAPTTGTAAASTRPGGSRTRTAARPALRPGDPDGHGRYARLDLDDDGRVICHECGRSWLHLATHLAGAHALTADEYRRAHGLAATRALVAPTIRDALAAAWHRHGADHEARLAEHRDPARARAVQVAGHDGGWSPETRERRITAARARRRRDLTADERARLAATGVDLQAWADVARSIRAADPAVSARALAEASDITTTAAEQRLRRYPPPPASPSQGA